MTNDGEATRRRGATPRRTNAELGSEGEDLAAGWYTARGYQVLDRNWRSRDGELDLVLARPGEVVFCEVKTRSTACYGLPAEAVTRAKRLRIRRLSAQWLAARRARAVHVRFDVAAVLAGEVEVIEAAF